MKIIKHTGDSKCIYEKKWYNACFQHDMAYGYFKYSNRRTAIDKVLHHKAFDIA